ncbi:MAG: PAS domain-containing protein [Devosia nanyangense]|uniref:histidine kinase n=1 Tax=Devosia nanyangense TaxID=1228055 RepID=A0A933L4T6_9HYPH|nr:PAS domain-containing protein [Devosia nanyangense]
MFDRAVTAKLSHSVGTADLDQEMAEPGLLLQLLESHLHLGIWRLEIPSGRLLWSRRVFEIYGQPFQPGPVDPTMALQSLVPEDRKAAGDIIVRAIQEKSSFEYTLRIMTGAGEFRLIECVGGMEPSETGSIRAVFGTVRDVTDRAQADELSAGRSSLLRSLLKNVPAAIAVFDRSMTYLAVSDHWLVGHGHKGARELIGRSHYAVRPDIAPDHKAEHQRVMAGEVVRSARGYLKDRHGRTISQICTMAPWLTPSGQVGGMILMLPVVDQDHVFNDVDPALLMEEPHPTMGEFLSLLKTVSA